ncbi:hypothetical protein H8356DRAFT_1352485 [Neocallimastix lanati (nom. inval.)]|nr:hypothetical protein H8356DRAFT_1352485 [Neocallimastix sp. JGI-2020a]
MSTDTLEFLDKFLKPNVESGLPVSHKFHKDLQDYSKLSHENYLLYKLKSDLSNLQVILVIFQNTQQRQFNFGGGSEMPSIYITLSPIPNFESTSSPYQYYYTSSSLVNDSRQFISNLNLNEGGHPLWRTPPHDHKDELYEYEKHNNIEITMERTIEIFTGKKKVRCTGTSSSLESIKFKYIKYKKELNVGFKFDVKLYNNNNNNNNNKNGVSFLLVLLDRNEKIDEIF